MATKKSKKNQENILFLLMGFIIIGLVIAGFFLFQKQITGLINNNSSNNPPTVNVQASASVNKQETMTQEEEFIPQDEVQTIQIYYGVKGKDKIECENKRVRKNTMLIGQARQIVNSLLENPRNERLFRLLPEGLTVRGLFYDTNVFTIDFSREFNQIYNYGANEQILTIYSIVNSLTELSPNAQVRFLVNGTEPDGEKGHIDLSKSLTRLETIIEK